MTDNTIEIRQISPAQTRPLRQEILRPGAALDSLVYPGDLDSDAFHVGAFDGAVQVGIATVLHQPPQASVGTPADHQQPDSADAWRLRGMAVSGTLRGRGVGGRLLAACLDYVRAHDGDFLWCDAREHAVAFYERHGFRIVGEGYIVPNVGPHYFTQHDLYLSDAA